MNWRMTFCAMATSFVTSVLLSCVDRNGVFHPEQISEVNQPGVFSFGKFTDDEYSWAELPLFAILGIWGGLVGAAFNTLYIRLYVISLSLSGRIKSSGEVTMDEIDDLLTKNFYEKRAHNHQMAALQRSATMGV